MFAAWVRKRVSRYIYYSFKWTYLMLLIVWIPCSAIPDNRSEECAADVLSSKWCYHLYTPKLIYILCYITGQNMRSYFCFAVFFLFTWKIVLLVILITHLVCISGWKLITLIFSRILSNLSKSSEWLHLIQPTYWPENVNLQSLYIYNLRNKVSVSNSDSDLQALESIDSCWYNIMTKG